MSSSDRVQTELTIQLADHSEAERLGRWLAKRNECSFQRKWGPSGEHLYTIQAQPWFIRKLLRRVMRDEEE